MICSYVCIFSRDFKGRSDMILLAYVLANVLLAEWADDMVYIHEWGVIEMDELFLKASGCPDGYIDEFGYIQEYPMPEVTAPVVYFYGADCSGTFTVRILEGSFTLLLPYPDSLAYEIDVGVYYSAVWENLTITSFEPLADATTEATIVTTGPEYENCFDWAVPFWRMVPANQIRYPSTGYDDVFIYYESIMSNPSIFIGDYYNHVGEALIFFREDGEMVCVNATVPIESDAVGETLSDLEIMAVLYSWGDGAMLSEEIAALWKTWKPLLRTRCKLENRTLMLFPLTDRQESIVSTLSFVPDANILVHYERLLLGLGDI